MTYYIKLETKVKLQDSINLATHDTKLVILRHKSRFRKAALSVRVRGRGSDVTHTGSGQDWK